MFNPGNRKGQENGVEIFPDIAYKDQDRRRGLTLTDSPRFLGYRKKGVMKGNTKTGMIFLALLLFFPTAQAMAATGSQILYESDSIYHHITVRQEGMERCMIFGRQRDLRQTCLDLEKPDAS
ncbi:MAG TPA: hypothetical protein DCZ97_16835, partial [Syntrophus sp. (in: bacteria)]|nr:hypothetical protein [Syntrophus sp. (in: bacteria)]